jgi:hypothetical protein
MRIRSGFLLLGFVSVSTAAALIACGSSSSSGGDDSSAQGNDSSTGGDTTTPPTVTANANDLTVYVGQTAVVQGSATPTSATFAWTVTSAPAGSTITSATLAGATTATPSFTPDVSGDYILTLTASASGVSGTHPATVHAVPGKGFISHQFDAGGGVALGNILYTNSDGTGQVPIVCPLKGGSGFVTILDSFGGLDWLEGDAGQPAVVAFPYADIDDAGNIVDSFLAAGTSDSRCGSPSVAKLDLQDAAAGGNVPRDVRLSSTGQRIAYLREVGSGLFAATIGFDGSSLRTFGPAFLATDGGPGPSNGDVLVPPTWVDSTQIAWIQLSADDSSWSIKIARDQDNATVDTFMTCNSAGTGSGAKVYEFSLLPDGTAIVAAQPSTFDAGNFVQLLILSPDPSTHVCTFVRSFSSGTGYATDFAVSPDKTQVAFLGSQSGTTNDYSLYVAAISGTTPPKIVPGAPTKSTEGVGPHWAANGHAIIWGQGAINDAGSPSTVFAIPSTGGTAKAIAASSDPSESFYSIGNSCNVAFENASPVAAFAMLGVFVGLVVRRKRSKKPTK